MKEFLIEYNNVEKDGLTFFQRQFLKEKYKTFQEPEDLEYYLGYFDDEKDPKKKAMHGSVPTKKVQTEPTGLLIGKINSSTSANQSNKD